MARSQTGLVGQIASVWSRVGDILGLHSYDESPGTRRWLVTVRADAEQAQRNDDDREYVVVRRQEKIRRARDANTRWAEELALAAIESQIGMVADARARASDVMAQGILPQTAESFFSQLIRPIADAQPMTDGRRLLNDALALADAEERHEIGLRLLIQIAGFEQEHGDVDAEDAAEREGLRRLGWGAAADPYRADPDRLANLQGWERDAALWLGQRILARLCRDDHLDDADRLATELRALAQDENAPSKFAEALQQQDGWIAYRRGDFERAERAWTDFYGYLIARPERNTRSETRHLVNLGFVMVRIGQFDAAGERAKEVIATTPEDGVRARAHALMAESALASGDEKSAREHAQTAAESESLAAQSAAHRVLAELELAAGRTQSAVEFAKQSVDEGCEEFGEDVFLVDRLLTLARAAADVDPALRDEALRRAGSIPMAAEHPFRRDVRRAEEELLG